MTVVSIPLWLQGGTYAANDDRALLRALVQAAGCVEPTGMSVVQHGTPNMSVDVNIGHVFVQRTSATDFYLTENPALANLTIAAADPTNPRRDLIVVRVYDAAFSGALNQATVEVVSGTPAGSPVDPTVPANSFVLARVAVAAAAASIVTANITDLRTYYQVNQPPNSNIVFSASGTLTLAQTNGARALRVRVWGPSGGGGSAPLAASNSANGAGGGGCGYAESLLAISAVTFPVTITVGTLGAAGTAGGAGGNGSGNSSFAAQVVASAGQGGQGGTGGVLPAVVSVGGAPGAGVTGDIKVTGHAGGDGVQLAAGTGSTTGYGGEGGGGAMGGGTTTKTIGLSAVGQAGVAPGGGGAGARTSGTGAAVNGGVGLNGLVIVELVY